MTSSPASSTAVTDGERLCVFFGSFGLLCYDLNGTELWRYAMGPFRNGWGASGSSPIIVGDAVILNVNNDDNAFLVALGKRTGKVMWQTPRNPQRSYATPMLWENAGRKEIVINGTEYVIAYDATSGKETWRCGGQTKYVNPTPVAGCGLLFTACNGPGGSVVMAIKPAGSGDITETHVAWQRMGTAPYVALPLLVGNNLFVIKNGGQATCYEASSGKAVWQSRLASTGNFYSSPICADGKIYVANEAGVFSVFAAAPEFRLLSTTSTGERIYATPAVVENRLYVRTEAALYCIGTP